MKTRIFSTWISIGFCFGIVGCASLVPAKVPGETTANARGRDEILGHIHWYNKAVYGQDCQVTVLDTRIGGREWDTIIEYWIVKACGYTTRYKVRIANGGRKYTVTFPKENE